MIFYKVHQVIIVHQKLYNNLFDNYNTYFYSNEVVRNSGN